MAEVVKGNQKQRFSLKNEGGEFYVRANQGHTINIMEDESLCTEVLRAEELTERNETCVHGTTFDAWEWISDTGLKPMSRVHIHFATHEPGHRELISGMRAHSEILIYLDVPKALENGMRIWRSFNNVLLTRGFDGVIPIEYFSRVVRATPRQIIWQNRELLPEERKQESALQQEETIFSLCRPHPLSTKCYSGYEQSEAKEPSSWLRTKELFEQLPTGCSSPLNHHIDSIEKEFSLRTENLPDVV